LKDFEKISARHKYLYSLSRWRIRPQKEKAILRKKGLPLDDFDLLIGATAISNDFILVTRNVSDFDRLDGIEIENWIDD
jgi:hypothetical protein